MEAITRVDTNGSGATATTLRGDWNDGRGRDTGGSG
jgi:hypothetical protein